MAGYHGLASYKIPIERKQTMKMYKKSNLSLTNGMLVSISGDIIVPDIRVVKQANALETIAQKARYLAAQPEATPMPSLDGFKRESIKDELIKDVKFEAKTPALDFEAAKAMALMDELDDVETVSKANAMLDKFTELLAFAKNDFVIDCGGNDVIPFDTPTLGSILQLTQQDIVDVVAMASGLEETKEERDCEDCEDEDCPFHPNYDGIHVKSATPEEAKQIVEMLESLEDADPQE